MGCAWGPAGPRLRARTRLGGLRLWYHGMYILVHLHLPGLVIGARAPFACTSSLRAPTRASLAPAAFRILPRSRLRGSGRYLRAGRDAVSDGAEAGPRLAFFFPYLYRIGEASWEGIANTWEGIECA